MSATPLQLYEEFLEHYGLEKGLYYHTVEMMDHPFEKVEKVTGVRLGKILVPLPPAVRNSVKFNVQLNLAPINAEKEIKKYIGSYKGLILDEDDVNLFCFTVEEAVLKNLLWPFHLLTEGAQLEEKDFFPLADMMEGVVCDTQEAIFAFLQGVLGSTDRIDAERDREVDRRNRQTDTWAANAPVEVRGSIRRNGKYLEVSATARSTVTSGMVNAEYQVHSLLANQSANREKAATQKALMNTLEQKLLNIISSYKNLWYERLKTLGSVIGKNVLRDSVCSTNAIYRADQENNMLKIFVNAPDDVSLSSLKRVFEEYGYDCDKLLGAQTSIRIINSFIKEKKIDVESLFYRFYSYYYGVEHALQHDALFQRLRNDCMNSARTLCKNVKEQHPDFYVPENCGTILRPVYDLAEALPGVTEKQKNRLRDDASYVFYDVLGDASMSKYYQEGAPRFEY